MKKHIFSLNQFYFTLFYLYLSTNWR